MCGWRAAQDSNLRNTVHALYGIAARCLTTRPTAHCHGPHAMRTRVRKLAGREGVEPPRPFKAHTVFKTGSVTTSDCLPAFAFWRQEMDSNHRRTRLQRVALPLSYPGLRVSLALICAMMTFSPGIRYIDHDSVSESMLRMGSAGSSPAPSWVRISATATSRAAEGKAI